MKRIVLLLVVFALSSLLFAGDLAAKDGPKVRIDEGAIYFGNSSDFDHPAVVDTDKVYMKIPEYREIRNKKIDSSNPRYLMLMRAATDKFLSAVEAAADAKGYDLIGGLGSIRIEGKSVPNITSLVIAHLPKD